MNQGARNPEAELIRAAREFAREPPLLSPTKTFRTTDQAESTQSPTGTSGGNCQERLAEQFGDFDLLHVLGQGGMGIVYKARQRSVGRVVALKMIRSGLFANEHDLIRFQNEVEAVAALDHPNIVPVLEVGQVATQRYYTMKFVDGGSLTERLPEFLADPSGTARIMATIARAVHHAHQRGILHRDLKPANILLDATGNPYVTDFGLARRMEDTNGLTQSGDVLGTPSYMAPEQAAGKRNTITTTTDVYGLGAILYVLLTGQAPFRGETLLETLELVRTRSPDSPSRVNLSVPRDLEVICLKCLEREPARRYASAEELATDLERWIAGKPIAARPVGNATRMAMWCRRNPVISSLVAALLVVLFAVVAGSTITAVVLYGKNIEIASQNHEINNQNIEITQKNEEVVRERLESDKNRDLAVERADLALEAYQTLFDEVQKKLEKTPQMQPLKRELLQSAADGLRKFTVKMDKQTTADPNLMAALKRLAELFKQNGDSDLALKLYKEVFEITSGRPEIKGSTDKSRVNLSLIYVEMAKMSESVERDLAGSLRYEEAAAELARNVLDHPKPGVGEVEKWQVQLLLGEVTARLGTKQLRIGKPVLAKALFQEALTVRQSARASLEESPTVAQFPEERKRAVVLMMNRNLGFSYLSLATVLERFRNAPQAESHAQDAWKLREEALAADPKSLTARSDVAETASSVGWFYLTTGRPTEALPYLQRARDTARQLHDADPKVTDYTRILALAHYRLGCLYGRVNDSQSAAEFAMSRDLRQSLVDQDPADERYPRQLMLALARCGESGKATPFAERFRTANYRDNEVLIDVARCYAQCASSEGQSESRDRFVQLSLQTLETAISNGYEDRVYLETEPDLEPLHTTQSWSELLSRLPAIDQG